MVLFDWSTSPMTGSPTFNYIFRILGFCLDNVLQTTQVGSASSQSVTSAVLSTDGPEGISQTVAGDWTIWSFRVMAKIRSITTLHVRTVCGKQDVLRFIASWVGMTRTRMYYVHTAWHCLSVWLSNESIAIVLASWRHFHLGPEELMQVRGSFSIFRCVPPFRRTVMHPSKQSKIQHIFETFASWCSNAPSPIGCCSPSCRQWSISVNVLDCVVQKGPLPRKQHGVNGFSYFISDD